MAKIERTKNASRNIFFGVILKGYQILVPFLMRTAMIYLMGVQYLGLNSLFTSILQVLNLAELGVGSAMVYSMYKPIADDDISAICGLMKLYRTYYRVIGAIIAVAGIILCPFVPRLINGDIPPEINVYLLYILNLAATVLSYWLFAYKNSILQAYQRIDIVSKVSLVINTIKFVLQFWVLWEFHNYYMYVIVLLCTQALSNVVTAIYADKLYPEYKPKGIISRDKVKKINQRIRDLFTAKLGGVIVGSADTIVISAFLGLSQLAIYQNYYFIIDAIAGFIFIIDNSICAGIGNSLVTESNDKNYHDFRVFNFLLFWLMGVCICCFLTLMQPFMELWVGKNLKLPYGMVILFCVYFFCNVYEKSLSVFKDAAGIWRSDRFRPLIYGGSNLVVNLLLVRICGLYGIIISTILTCATISIPWIINNIFKMIYKRESKEYLRECFQYIIMIVVAGIINYFLCELINGNLIYTILFRSIVSLVISNIIFILAFHKRKVFIESLNLIKKMIHIK